ncbi:MAG: signal recognition particle-docking protein FtsY [Candidatus Tectomicrobia bacterium]|nr:signal recognition particle-docking protein FtsY [Candidatus Tectomicrobia bacterium]
MTGFFAKLKEGLGKTRASLLGRMRHVLSRGGVIDAASLEELEELLIAADLGVHTVTRLIDGLRRRTEGGERFDAARLTAAMREMIGEILRAGEAPLEVDRERPFVIMVIGVNGVGKTTTIAKLAAHYRGEGKKVLLAAGDTFRAAAIEQLEVWGTRAQVDLVKHQAGADSSAVLFDALQAARARGVDLLIADTAGRLHTRVNLMEELKKNKRVLRKQMERAPHEVLLVLDATNGQNAVQQAEQFSRELGVTGLALTKLDGTAKGGVIVNIIERLRLPVRFVGVGEGLRDLQPFVAEEFLAALFEEE